ncbi:hypothetical protein [Paraclostridium bifermentans]|uniref:hypothetical protein n=1 Tax=Paraclostridium bifermentans TaxID=1490 RepID=UPI0011577AC1|nr:hypothetical protein [Paraclostridium bifermentans]TQO58101.1 hypothetical protein D5S05_09200 [Paraclostridium bifermentans]GKZ02119.1 hypothetical protein ANS014_05530 [Paraclostridium bifermentans]GKZ08372.1 hypothetical protein ANS015_32550 [Paraclostridium bifermentans]GKZ11156.1 hypothetical protein ANS017_25400 [Paraclostridium bifermentans]
MNTIAKLSPLRSLLYVLSLIFIYFSIIHSSSISGGIGIFVAGLINSYDSYIHYKTFNALNFLSIVFAVMGLLIGFLLICFS